MPGAPLPGKNKGNFIMNHKLIFMLAALSHGINKAYCQAIGDNSQSDWDDAPDWQKESAIEGVKAHLAGTLSPEQSHESWLKQKVYDGWVYGEIKDPDTKTHPCCVPYDDLPPEQKAKDYLFGASVKIASEMLSTLMPSDSSAFSLERIGTFNADGRKDVEEIKSKAREFIDLVYKHCPEGRRKSFSLTQIETAQMYAVKSLFNG